MYRHLVLIAIAALCGCVTITLRHPLKVDYLPVTDAQLPAVPPEQVTVYQYGTDDDSWPEGIAMRFGQMKNPSDHLELAPDYPTAEDPHRLLGGLKITTGDRVPQEAVRKELVAFAGSRGANAVFIVGGGHRLVTAAAVRVSTAKPASNHPSADQGISSAAQSLGPEFKKDGSPINGTLDAFRPLTIAARRGRCYAIAFALDSGASFSKHARKGMMWKLKSPDADLSMGQHYVSQVPNELTTLRSKASDLGCPQVDGPLEMDLQATFGSARRDAPVHDLGKGPVTFQVFSRAVSEEQLAKQKAATERLWKEAAQRDQERAKEKCAECRHLLAWCDDRPQDCREYVKCLSTKATRVEECQ